MRHGGGLRAALCPGTSTGTSTTSTAARLRSGGGGGDSGGGDGGGGEEKEEDEEIIDINITCYMNFKSHSPKSKCLGARAHFKVSGQLEDYCVKIQRPSLVRVTKRFPSSATPFWRVSYSKRVGKQGGDKHCADKFFGSPSPKVVAEAKIGAHTHTHTS